MANNSSYILWLPSWYPNKIKPFDGDFIQRHARAAARYDDIHVIFFTQFGEKVQSNQEIEIKQEGTLKEMIVYLPFHPIGIFLIDKIIYNLKFYSFAKKILKKYFDEYGLPRLVHVHVPVKSGNLALWAKRKFRLPFVVSEHASTYLRHAPDNYYQRHRLYKRQVKHIFERSDHVTNVSNAVGKILLKLFHIQKLSVIHNVVDTSIFKYESNHSKVFTYIHVSSLTEQKNIDGILHTFLRLSLVKKDWKLIVAGPYTEDILSFITENDLEDLIELTGEIPYQQVAACMQRSHVMVLFSKHENFPCVVVEALCCGLPVLSSDVAGINEAVNDSNGILIPSEDEDGLLQSLITIRESYDFYDNKKISEEAKSKYSYDSIGAQFHNLYTGINDKTIYAK